MDQGLLVMEATVAGAELVQKLDQNFPIRVAFWVIESDEGQWYLYIASDEIKSGHLDAEYGAVPRVADQMASPHLDPFQVKLVPTDHPVAQAALELQRLYPSPRAIRFGGPNFGGLGVDGVYIYPSSVTMLTP